MLTSTLHILYYSSWKLCKAFDENTLAIEDYIDSITTSCLCVVVKLSYSANRLFTTSSFAIKKSRFDFADELKVGYVRYKHLTQITIKVQLFWRLAYEMFLYSKTNRLWVISDSKEVVE